jgi:phosphatidate cytidylyltransferase
LALLPDLLIVILLSFSRRYCTGLESDVLKKRVITALWGIPILIAAVWFDEPLPWFTVLVAIVGVAAAIEFYRIVDTSRVPPLTGFGLVWVLLFIISPHFGYGFSVPLLLTSGVVFSLIWLVLRRHGEAAFIGWAWTMAGVLYIGWLLSYLVALRGLEDGRSWLLLALFVTFGSDTAAFFTGRALGRHRLAPQISPGKTWEGFVGGILGAIVISLIFTLIPAFRLPIGYGGAIILGVLISIMGQLGDLIESLLKRNMGVKDSGRLMPGHGGILDRMDSVVFAGIVVYYYVIWVVA